jgi:hypothetical protein
LDNDHGAYLDKTVDVGEALSKETTYTVKKIVRTTETVTTITEVVTLYKQTASASAGLLVCLLVCLCSFPKMDFFSHGCAV